ncbi:MAG: hypothetical protein A2161_03480 [Candidatus Schekmanbacteria bacterium RBG_13_48_7]|uniref:Uncharacterized protein n=1 Tax=Candidatus Schekmanbacteria bacterium RBG_13_48_7 TaxID=1817878 RepID=A0A1F7S7W9_9BACT|nr:MAG: hypothetical protein A2161_03480 [Candidatus Schekmanbacteria bacterium RBG_13_48_7]
MDRIILTGAINFHYFAGFGGGRKIQSVCMTSLETIRSNHKLSVSGKNGSFHEKVAPGILDGNPVHEDMMEITRFREPDFLLNVVLDDDGKLLKCFAGNYKSAHEAGCKYICESRMISIKHPVDLVIAGCGGYPFDVNFIQSHKTMDFSCRVLKEGGSVILIAACSEGIGNPNFLQWFEQNPDYKSFRESVAINYQLNGHTALATFVKSKKFNLKMFTKLSGNDLHTMNINKIDDINKTVKDSTANLSSDGKIIAIPNGHAILPVCSIPQ